MRDPCLFVASPMSSFPKHVGVARRIPFSDVGSCVICSVFSQFLCHQSKTCHTKIKNTKQFPQLLCHPNGIYYTFILYLGIVKNIFSSNDLRQVGDRWLFHLSQVINFSPFFLTRNFPKSSAQTHAITRFDSLRKNGRPFF